MGNLLHRSSFYYEVLLSVVKVNMRGMDSQMPVGWGERNNKWSVGGGGVDEPQ